MDDEGRKVIYSKRQGICLRHVVKMKKDRVLRSSAIKEPTILPRAHIRSTYKRERRAQCLGQNLERSWSSESKGLEITENKMQ